MKKGSSTQKDLFASLINLQPAGVRRAQNLGQMYQEMLYWQSTKISREEKEHNSGGDCNLSSKILLKLQAR